MIKSITIEDASYMIKEYMGIENVEKDENVLLWGYYNNLDELMAISSIKKKGDTIWLPYIIVRSDYHGLKFGTNILRQIENKVRCLCYHELFVEPIETSMEFFIKNGYKIDKNGVMSKDLEYIIDERGKRVYHYPNDELMNTVHLKQIRNTKALFASLRNKKVILN